MSSDAGRSRQQGAPEPPQDSQRNHPAPREDYKIGARNAEDVAEEQAMQIDPNVRKERQHDQAEGKASMTKQPQDGIGRQRIAPFEVEHQQDD